jgi:hypothetical protein
MISRVALWIALTCAVIGAVALASVLPVSHSGGALRPAIAAAALDTADENQVQKAVPILSLGSGLRVGMALVTGPSSQVNKVKVVAQIEGDFKGARIRALVPIETESLKDVRRVPETSVSGLADLKL